MNSHALNVLEFPRTLALISERAGSPLGAERVRELRPLTDPDEIEREHARVAAVRSLLSADEPWTLDGVPDARSALTRLRVERSTLGAPDLLILGALLRSSRLTRESLRGRASPVATAVLSAQIELLFVNRATEEVVERAIDEDGQVKDDATS